MVYEMVIEEDLRSIENSLLERAEVERSIRLKAASRLIEELPDYVLNELFNITVIEDSGVVRCEAKVINYACPG